MMAQLLPQTTTIRSDPKFSKSLTGDFTFDLDCQRSRCPPFLLRNIRQLLSYHKRSLSRESVSKPDSNYGQHEVHQYSACTHCSTCCRAQGHAALAVHVPALAQSQPLPAGPVAQIPEGNHLFEQVLPIRAMKSHGLASRRSSRKFEEQIYDNDLAELILNLSSIRKLLNFTSNKPEENERPQKRVKKDYFKCQCSLTIWDNRPNLGTSDAIVKRSVFCNLTSTDNGVYGPCVLISLDKPFIIKAGELKVPIVRDGEASLEIVDGYFMEVKIIPTRPDVNWPPIPILGKSDGDHYSGPGRLPSEALAGALVMKYKELPRAPDSNTPLKAFFLYDGVTFKTKYGLEVSAKWRRPSSSTDDLLDAQLGVGKVLRHDPPSNIQSARKSTTTKEAVDSRVPNSDISLVQSVKQRRRKVKVVYHFEPNTCRSQGVPVQYRTAEVAGLVCPACPAFKASDLQELRFHFLSSHHKYNFALGEVIEDELRGELREVIIEVTPVPIPKPTSRRIKQEEEFEWVVKATPFDLAAFLDGDTSWLGIVGEDSKSARRISPAPVSEVKLLTDPITSRRSQHDGFLSAEDVRDFRKAKRKKHANIKLVRRIDEKVATYSSISHRQTYSSEDPMSDTDDEVEDEWFIQRHLENLAIAAKEENWNSMKQELFKRWDRHRLEEKLEHTRFLSDSLIRFVRKEKRWLVIADARLEAAFAQLLGELSSARLIGTQVPVRVQNMIAQAKALNLTDPIEQRDTHTNKPTRQQPKSQHVDAATKVSPANDLRDDTLKSIHVVFRILQPPDGFASQEHLTADQLSCFTELDISPTQVNEEFRKWKISAIQPDNLDSSTKDLPEHPTPEQEIAAWRTTILALPPGHCGGCAQPVLRRVVEGMHCSSPTCTTPGACFHLRCTKLKNRRADWVCRGCRAEAKLKLMKDKASKGKGKGKGKGKERAVDGRGESVTGLGHRVKHGL